MKILKWIYNVYAIIVFIALMIPVFLFGLAISFFGTIRGGNLIYQACMIWGDIWFFFIFIRHTNIYEQPLKKGQSYIFIANHISYMDSPIVVKTIRQPVRPLGKVEMIKIPIFGFIYRKVIVTVDRSSAENRSRSVQLLKSILQKGISILVFPEGTFNLTHRPLKDFYDGAFRIAIETGTPIKPLVFLDSYERMPYESLFSLNPGRSRAVFLKEVATTEYTIDDTALLRQNVYELMEKKLIEYNASWIEI